VSEYVEVDLAVIVPSSGVVRLWSMALDFDLRPVPRLTVVMFLTPRAKAGRPLPRRDWTSLALRRVAEAGWEATLWDVARWGRGTSFPLGVG
jgi:hypothetical protein